MKRPIKLPNSQYYDIAASSSFVGGLRLAVACLVLAWRPAAGVEPQAMPRAEPEPASTVAAAIRLATVDAQPAPQRADIAPVGAAAQALVRPSPPAADWSHSPRRKLSARRR